MSIALAEVRVSELCGSHTAKPPPPAPPPPNAAISSISVRRLALWDLPTALASWSKGLGLRWAPEEGGSAGAGPRTRPCWVRKVTRLGEQVGECRKSSGGMALDGEPRMVGRGLILGEGCRGRGVTTGSECCFLTFCLPPLTHSSRQGALWSLVPSPEPCCWAAGRGSVDWRARGESGRAFGPPVDCLRGVVLVWTAGGPWPEGDGGPILTKPISPPVLQRRTGVDKLGQPSFLGELRFSSMRW